MGKNSQTKSGLTKMSGLGLLVVASFVLSSCSSESGTTVDEQTEESSNSNSSEQSILRLVLPQEPPTLEPCEANLQSVGVVVRSNITEPLVERNPENGELEPLLATSWEKTSETDWTFTLRDGVTFSDGSEFSAQDAAFSIERAVNSDLGCNVEGYIFGDDDLGLEVVDSQTLVVSTVSEDPLLPLRLSFIEIVPESTDTSSKVREPVGTGPYKLDDWDEGTKITLSRNDSYWSEAPAFEFAEYQWRAEGTVRAGMVTTGEADIALNLSEQDGIGEFGADHPNNETVKLRMSADIAPLNDIRVRRAIDHAIDRDGIVNGLYGGKHEVAAQSVPASIIGHDTDLEPTSYDPGLAQELLAEAEADGVSISETMTMIVREPWFPNSSELGEVLQQQLTEVGLNVDLKFVDTATHIDDYILKPFVVDEGPILTLLQHGNQAGDSEFTIPNHMSESGTINTINVPEMENLISEARPAVGSERAEAWKAVYNYERENVVQYAFISHQTGLIGVGENVTYVPNSISADELRLSEVEPAS